MNATRVKICGVCTPGDAALAAAAGAAYVGVVLVPGRKRGRTVPEAAEILAAAAGVKRVGVFADAAVDDMLRASEALRLDVLQLHGHESVVDLVKLRGLGGPHLWKAVAVTTPEEALRDFEAYGAVADAVLLDGGDGGRGVPFDWAMVRPLRSRLPRGVELVVAGGLTPENVARAIAELDPEVVDVSSGVETSPGCKSPERVRAFVAAARGHGVA
jgi:phosphoribosylanthranilate isomerase